ncbi:MAG: PEP-CTERM sorting domain-containing protein, partial [Aquabacterium sp.]
VESGCGLLTINRLCLSTAGVATTATGIQDPGFWNMILAPHTRVIMDARSFVEVLLHDVCTTTCSFVFAQAQLRAEFGPFTDGLPDSLVRRTSANTVFLDSAVLGGTGGVFTDSSEMSLHLVFENNTDQEVMGRIRWLVQVQAVTAVPEPGTYALMALGLVALVAARRRRV